jgi:DNA helicase-2/ATP-dependent DNA helicase PcrA
MELTPQQREAIEHDRGPLLIIAGAGTGKTLVITHRIAHLISDKRARPEEILALTFTEKAAKEMEERVDQLVPYGYADVWISTFHAFGHRVLRDHAVLLGLPPTFRVLTRPEQVLFLREHLFELPLSRLRPLGNPTKHLEALLTTISRAKDEDVSPSDYLAYAEKQILDAQTHSDEPERLDETTRQLEVARTYEKYQKLLAQSGFIDFGDQVALTLKLFREHPSVLAHYQKRFRYILVDEFQDTNYAQYQMVKLLGREHRNLTVVGDDDQSIYRFRGAAMSNILLFREDWSDAKCVVLTENRRSTQAILDCAYRLIRHNDPERLEVKVGIHKLLIAKRDVAEPLPVRHLHYDTLSSETDGVARLIKERRDRGWWAYRDVAILVRANEDADPFLRSLNLYGVPWHFSGSRGLYSLPEVRQLIAFLRILADPHHSTYLYFLASSPLYHLPMDDLTQCNRLCHRQHVSLYTVFRQAVKDPSGLSISAEGQATISKILEDVSTYQELSREHSVGVVLYEFFKRSGWLKRLSEANTPKADMELQNIARFFDGVRRFETLTEHPTVPGFVEHLDALIEAGDDPPTAQADTDADAVTVLTLHKAKGLEFSVVFMVSLVEQKFPSRDRHDAIELPEGLIKDILPQGDVHLQEERRLFYVGMTRAMNELYLTGARDYGTERERKVSRFAVEALDLNPKNVVPLKSSPVEAIERHAPPAEAPEVLTTPISPDEPLQLSYYKIDDYLTCPLKYKYSHILHMPIYQHHAVIYGAALHQAIAAYLRAKVHGHPFSLSDLQAVFEREWRSEGFISREHEEQRFATGQAVLKRFYEREEARGLLPTAVEETFKFSLGSNIITGRWDRIDVTDDEAVIVDYKSSEITDQKKADRATKENLQLSIYTLAYQAKTGRLPKEVQLHFLESGLIGRAVKTTEALEKTKDTIADVAEGIRAQDFTAQPTYLACSYCAYREICPYTSFGKETE